MNVDNHSTDKSWSVVKPEPSIANGAFTQSMHLLLHDNALDFVMRHKEYLSNGIISFRKLQTFPRCKFGNHHILRIFALKLHKHPLERAHRDLRPFVRCVSYGNSRERLVQNETAGELRRRSKRNLDTKEKPLVMRLT